MEHRFQPSRYWNTLGGHEPVLRVQDGDTIITTTVDARGYDVSGKQVTERGNPQTGPFYVEGAAPGDTLAVQLERITPNREHGWNSTVVAAHVVDAGYVAQLPEGMLADWRVDVEHGVATLTEPETALGSFSVPIRPMLGCFGVAPRGGQALGTGTSAENGGNMDYRGFCVGTTAYFPVFVEGALFSLGDGHAQQADGEILGSSIEISMDVQVTLRLLKAKQIGWPRGEDAEWIFSVGNARPLDQALQHATTEMVRWLQSDYGLDARAAHILLGHTVRYDIGNVYDPAYTIVCKVPKTVLPR